MNNFSNVKLNGEEISMMKLNGTIIYQKGTIPEPELPIVAKYTLSDTSQTSPTYVGGKASDWTETVKNNNDGTYTVTINASKAPISICFDGMTSLISMDYLDVSKLYHSELMFAYCTNLKYVNTSNWNKDLYDMANMFKNCVSLTSLDLSGITTQSHNVGIFDSMFNGCSNLKTLDISNFYLNYFDMEEGYMARNTFDGCTSLHTVRMDNCNYWAMYEIVLPSNTIPGVTKNVYCREENMTDYYGEYRISFYSWTINYIE